ncbi:MAG: hypothetical protein JST01_20330 [Cyanobacteria bacterium SZAS TMP-1]|nr:hypothetical protein [Cyanobacteria bacterium SZAS TMP-1]
MPAIDPPFEFEDPVNEAVVVLCCNYTSDRVGLGLFVLNGGDIDFEVTKLDLISLVEAFEEIEETSKEVVLKFPGLDGEGPSIAKLTPAEEAINVMLAVPDTDSVQSLNFAIAKTDIVGLVEFLQPAL